LLKTVATRAETSASAIASCVLPFLGKTKI